jgi:hypothetical protein
MELLKKSGSEHCRGRHILNTLSSKKNKLRFQAAAEGNVPAMFLGFLNLARNAAR